MIKVLFTFNNITLTNFNLDWFVNLCRVYAKIEQQSREAEVQHFIWPLSEIDIYIYIIKI